MDFDAMKYAELRNVAKDLGLKGNMKADKLLKLIKQHYQKEKNEEEEQGQGRDATAAVEEDVNAGQGAAQESEDATPHEEVSNTAVFVNTRRGRGNGTKRKISDTEAECDESPPTAAEGDVEAAASAAPSGARRSKKRKVSSVKDSDQTEPQKDSQVPESVQQLADVTDEAPVHGTVPEKATKAAKAGKIPRHQGLQLKNKQLKPVTPNFKKLHEAHFNKMESIDSYMQRKTKQMDTYRASVKELKNLSDKTQLQQADGKTQAKANQSRTSILSPAPVNKRPADGRRTLLSARKAPKEAAGKKDAPFRPSVLSTRRINVRFSEATRDNEFKGSLVKTPARMSPCVTSSTPQIQKTGEVKSISVKTTTFSAAKTSGAFIFTGNTSTAETPGTQKKQSFDLKASLSRPLSYKPHTGKLKAFGDVKENTTTAADKSLISNSHQKNYKKHQVPTRDNRREKHTADRKQKKESVLGARRGLVMM
ncbi:nucleolar and spindle-associated protein 1 [Platichthys flesus]|uniref:nucleolar and spindle-associated protein 1 n=1 Tax=Platichthys flesus TaxID=8260 RepID=UPI002DB56002|nr:nucleolar and spindle-associated protein 1 [Platichthys flesus]